MCFPREYWTPNDNDWKVNTWNIEQIECWKYRTDGISEVLYLSIEQMDYLKYLVL
jgi:hypothetical protein